MKEIIEIKKYAEYFRNAIMIACQKGEFYGDSFSRFPKGCCGDASELLSEYLLEKGINTIYVCGTYYEGEIDDRQSHAWLEYNDIVIDITGDQFSTNPTFLEYDIPVYVGEQDLFHKLFEVLNCDKHPSGIMNLGVASHDRMYKLYDIIKKYL